MKSLLEKVVHLKQELCCDTVIITGDINFESTRWNEMESSELYEAVIVEYLQRWISTANYRQEKTTGCYTDRQSRSYCEYPRGQPNETAFLIQSLFIPDEVNE